MSWSEARLHAWLARTAPARVRGVAAAFGSDAVPLAPTPDRIVVCVDQTIEGVHYAPEVAPARAGAKAVARAVSDLAASAARPVGVLLALSLPKDADERRVRAGLRGVRERARELGAELLGGDLASAPGPWTWSVTALGRQDARRRAIGRHGARAGDVLVVTGPLGGAGLGRHLRIEPRVDEGRWLASIGARAMMDTSDGAALDLERLAAASGVGLELDELPVHRDARRAERTDGIPAWRHALVDGEDHELFAAVPARVWAEHRARAARRFPALRAIGRVVRGRGAHWTDPTGARRGLGEFGGWLHG